MIIYEVNLDVDGELRSAYLPWLQDHVTQMLQFDGFESATIESVTDPAAAEGRFAVCVRYRVRDMACLEDYLSAHAPRMRADGMARFGDGFRATRRILATLG